MSDLLSDVDITLASIEGLFKSAFFRTDHDKDGDLVVRDEGVNTFVKVNAERKTITLFSLWGLKEAAPEVDKLKFANKLNDSMVLVRFAVSNPTTLWCDYQFMYEGGIAPFQLINTYKRFVSVCRGAQREDEAGVLD
jgi:hypothetical protein